MSMPRWLGLVSLLFFVLSSVVGFWAAYDRSAAIAKCLMILVGLSLALGIVRLGKGEMEHALAIVGVASCLAIASLGSRFVLSAKVPSGPTANALCVLLPLALGAYCWKPRGRSWVVLLADIGLAIGIVALILASERSAWFSLGIGCLGAALLSSTGEVSSRRPWHWLFGGFVVLTVVGLLWYVAAIIVPANQGAWVHLPASPLAERLPLWQDSLALIRDYPFTGSGPGNMAMVFSSYVFLLHVPFQNQAHNLFLQVAIEQGVPGLVAFLGMAIGGAWSLMRAIRGQHPVVRRAALFTMAALCAMLVYGLFDSEAYATHLLPVLFVPLGCAWALDAAVSISVDAGCPSKAMRLRQGFRAAIPCLVLSSLLLWPVVGAKLLANLAAVAQSQAELSVYSWPKWGLQDGVRRARTVDLSGAVLGYRAALLLDPFNVTANRRLGQIELAQGNYSSAQQHLEVAYRCAPEQRATRQLLGEIYAISGKLEQAVNLWRDVDTSHGQLDARQWWYDHMGTERESELLRKAIALLKEKAGVAKT